MFLFWFNPEHESTGKESNLNFLTVKCWTYDCNRFYLFYFIIIAFVNDVICSDIHRTMNRNKY